MAKNLRAKIPEGDTMTVFDVNQTALDKFSQEAVPAGVGVAKSPREVVENSVSLKRCILDILHCMMSLLFYL